MGLHTPGHKFIDRRGDKPVDDNESVLTNPQSNKRAKLSVAQVQKILEQEEPGEWEAGQVLNLPINTLK